MRTLRISEREKQSKAVRELNDRFRQSVPDACDLPGRVIITAGIQALIDTDEELGKHLPRLFEEVRSFDDFTGDNDPYGEHDFGAFDFEGTRVFWKVDYYAPDMMHGSENPADAEKTVRVLTIMLAEEY